MSEAPDTAHLAAGVRRGDVRALARSISLIENGEPEAAELVRLLYPATGRAQTVGVTGPPGVGKSTLISALVAEARGLGLTVGVLSIDPSSPFTRGALLGDRIRLAEHSLDVDVFIRSLGTRGHPGGLSESTLQSLLVLDAAGKDVVFVETVGTGQSEIGVLGRVDTIVLALMPGAGDSVQALKAGIMEIPDVIAITKRDHPQANAAASDVRNMLSLGGQVPPPILLTEAVRGEGVAELWAAIASHKAALEADGSLQERRRARLAADVVDVASARARRHLENAVGSDSELQLLLEQVKRRELDPLTAVQVLLRKVFAVDHED